MTNIYMIRHAEAEGNLYRRLQGHYDSLVTDLGHRQIEALRARFKDTQIDAVYSSDLVRTQLTARALSVPRNLPIHTNERLREVYVGDWEDRPWGALERLEAKQLAYFSLNPARWDIGNNESLEALTQRMVSIVTEIAAQHKGQTVAVFTHGTVIRALLLHIQGIPSERIAEVPYCDNTGVSLLEVDGRDMRIVFMNNADHLGEELSTFARQGWWRKKTLYERENLDFLPLDLTRDEAKYLAWRQHAHKTPEDCLHIWHTPKRPLPRIH